MEATPRTNRSAKGGARSSLHYGGEGVLIHPPQQGVCGRHGTEDLSLTPGGLSGSSGGTEGSDPISASEMGSSVLGVVGRPNSTRSAAKATRPGAWRQSVSGKAAGEDGGGETESEMSKAGGGQFPQRKTRTSSTEETRRLDQSDGGEEGSLAHRQGLQAEELGDRVAARQSQSRGWGD